MSQHKTYTVVQRRVLFARASQGFDAEVCEFLIAEARTRGHDGDFVRVLADQLEAACRRLADAAEALALDSEALARTRS